jgi:tetratricopeptide (TPR) repeat protein
MHLLLPAFGLLLLILSPLSFAAAQEAEAPKKAEVPFREDSGLITAEFYLATGKNAQALEVLAGVLARHPASADAYDYRGFAYERLGDMKKAKESYARALEINPAHLGANRYLAGIYLQEGNLSRAIEQMQVIRMICGDIACAELDELSAEVNRYKAGQKEPQAQKRARFAPATQMRSNE